MTPGALASALWSAELRTGSGAPIELAAGQVNRSQHRRLCCPVSVSSRVITVANGLFAHGHLGELAQIHPLEMAGVALAETGAVQQRLPEDLRPGGGLPAARPQPRSRSAATRLCGASSLPHWCGRPARPAARTGHRDPNRLPDERAGMSRSIARQSARYAPSTVAPQASTRRSNAGRRSFRTPRS